jgi:hypothetical protein
VSPQLRVEDLGAEIDSDEALIGDVGLYAGNVEIHSCESKKSRRQKAYSTIESALVVQKKPGLQIGRSSQPPSIERLACDCQRVLTSNALYALNIGVW